MARVAGALVLLAALPSITAAWNVGDTAQPGQWTIYNRAPNGAGLGLPVASGDIDGDGFDDAIVTPMNADSGPLRERLRAGEAVIALSSGSITGILDVAGLDPLALPAGVGLVYGADTLDLLGTHVEAADLDGDGHDDVLLGAQNADGPDDQRTGAGEVAIIWGGPEIGGRVIDLDLVPLAGVTVIYGADAGDRLGTWVGAGDFDGDGTADAILGADQGNGPDEQRPHAGETYVVYGGPALRALRRLDLAQDSAATRVYGIDADDHSGSTVRGADLDGDGVAELMIGAGLNRLSSSIDDTGMFGAHGFAGGDGPSEDRPNAGEAYLIYGRQGVRPAAIDLRSPPASTTVLYGVDPGDTYGEELGAGDFDGDGMAEIAIGALTADGPHNSRDNAGDTALVFGHPGLPGSVIDLAAPPSGVVFFYGAAGQDISGDTALLLDVDGDGRDDLLIGSPGASPGERSRAGVVTVFFGTAAPLPAAVDLAQPPLDLTPLVIEGNSPGDILCYSAARGDADGDGFADAVINAMGASGFDDLAPGAGEAYVLSGARLAAFALTPSATPTMTETPTVTETPTWTETPSHTPTAASTPTVTQSAAATQTGTIEPTSSHTPAPAATATPTSTSGPTSPAPTTAPPPAAGGGCSASPSGGGAPVWLVLGAVWLVLAGVRRRAPL